MKISLTAIPWVILILSLDFICTQTRARVLVAKKRYREADRIMAGVIKTFDKGGESALLANALTLQGLVWARVGAFENSINMLRQAMKVAQDSGALARSGQAALTLLEEHGASRRLAESELVRVYARADELLKGTQDAEDITRLRACARVVLKDCRGWNCATRISHSTAPCGSSRRG